MANLVMDPGDPLIEELERQAEAREPERQARRGALRRNRAESDCEAEVLFVADSHPKTILSGMNDIRHEGTFYDVTVMSEGEAFRCHRVVLAAASPYFKAMFMGRLAESTQEKVIIHDVKAHVLRSLIDYMYTSSLSITTGNVQDLLAAADVLQMLVVREACCQFLVGHLDDVNCLSVKRLAERYACEQLAADARQYALHHFKDVAQHADFLDLGQDDVIDMLADDAVHVTSEDEVLDAAVRWRNHNEAVRAPTFDAILTRVRLPQLSPDCLAGRAAACVSGSPECLALLESARSHDPPADHSPPGTQPRIGRRVLVTFSMSEFDDLALSAYEIRNSPLQFVHRSTDLVGNDDYLPGELVGCGHPLYTVHQEGLYTEFGARVKEVRTHGIHHLANTTRLHDPATMFAIADKLYILGCINPKPYYRTMFSLTLAGDLRQWTMEDVELPVDVRRDVCVVADGIAYIVGGWNYDNNHIANSVFSWRPGAGSWAPVAPMLWPRCRHGLVTVHGEIYALGGTTTDSSVLGILASVERYTPATNTWTFMPDMLRPEMDMSVSSLGDLILVMVKSSFTHIDVFNTFSRQWSTVALARDPDMFLCSMPTLGTQGVLAVTVE